MRRKDVVAVLLALITAGSLCAGCGSTSNTSSESNGKTDTSAEESTLKNDSGQTEESETNVSQTDANSTNSNSDKQVTIQFMHDWPEYEEQFNQIVEDFEKENPNIKVETQVITWDVLTQTLTTDFASGEVPDVACCWANQMGTFNSLNAVYDLTSYMEENNKEWENSLLTPAVQLGTVDGKVFCVPFRTTCTVLAYNKTMMDENGWKIPDNLEEMESLMDEVKAKGITPILAPGNPHGFQMESIAETFAMYNLYESGILTSEEYLTGHYTKVESEYAKAGEKIRDWISKGYLDAAALSMTREDSTGQFYQQKGLFAFINNNELADVEKNSKEAGFDIGVMAFPAPQGAPQLLYHFGVDGFMVYSGTEHPDESVQFLRYITSDEVQQKFGNETASVMANKNCTYDNENQNKFSEIFSNAQSYRINYDYNSGSIANDMGDELSNFVSDTSVTPEEYGEKIEELCTECLNENG